MASKELSIGSTSPSDSTPDTLSSTTTTTIDHDNRLKGWPLMKAVAALNVINGVAFFDIMGSPSLTPTLARDTGLGRDISYATTAALVMAVVGQCIFNYFSDFLGRKIPLVLAIAFLSVGALGTAFCDFEHNLGMLIVFRGFAGLGFGSISGLVNILQSDYLDKERRQIYQGFQGVSVAAGSALGMITAAVFSELVAGRGRWQYFYYTQVGLNMVAFALALSCVPAKHRVQHCWMQAGGWRGLVRLIDWIGIIFGILAIVPTLILATQGRDMKKDSVLFLTCVALLLIGTVVFWLNGYYGPVHGARPIMPFKFFRNRTILAIYMQNILLGFAYNTLITYMPMYLTFVRQLTMMRTALFMLSYVCTHGACSTASAWFVILLERRGILGYTVAAFVGFSCWTVALVIFAFVSRLSDPVICFLLVLTAVGTGKVFQNAVNAIRNEVQASENATALGARNVLRYFGGAVGTAVNSSVLEKCVKATLKGSLATFAEHPFDRPDTKDLTVAQSTAVTEGFRYAFQNVFLLSAVAIAIATVLCFLLIKPRATKQVLEVLSKTTSSRTSSSGTSFDTDMEKQSL
ncbi:hypothetical protein LTR86_002028 [Recurvomyces mirabilis]|nr:hypothetical protein LTR86_002028 [Recurvomyces mirabilis]